MWLFNGQRVAILFWRGQQLPPVQPAGRYPQTAPRAAACCWLAGLAQPGSLRVRSAQQGPCLKPGCARAAAPAALECRALWPKGAPGVNRAAPRPGPVARTKSRKFPDDAFSHQASRSSVQRRSTMASPSPCCAGGLCQPRSASQKDLGMEAASFTLTFAVCLGGSACALPRFVR